MTDQINIAHLIEATDKKNMVQLGETIFKFENEVIEIIEVNYDLKIMKFRHNHNTHTVQFKNNLDLTLDKMGIKRSFEAVNTDVKAPMPGKILDIMVKKGDEIKKGDPLLVLEAMKMENVLKSESDCVIKSVVIERMVSVEKNQLLIELETE